MRSGQMRTPASGICGADRGHRRARLRQPLQFPPLAQAAVPGDKVALALDRGVPQAPAIVAGAIAVLMSAGVLPEDITLLRADGRR